VDADYPDVASDNLGKPLTERIEFHRWVGTGGCEQVGRAHHPNPSCPDQLLHHSERYALTASCLGVDRGSAADEVEPASSSGRRDVEQSDPFTLPGVARAIGLGHPAVHGAILDQVEDDIVELAALEAVRGARVSGHLPRRSLDVAQSFEAGLGLGSVGGDDPDGSVLLQVLLGQDPGEQAACRPPSGHRLGAADDREIIEAIGVEQDDLRVIVVADWEVPSAAEVTRVRHPIGEVHQVDAEAVLCAQDDASMSLLGAYIGIARVLDAA